MVCRPCQASGLCLPFPVSSGSESMSPHTGHLPDQRNWCSFRSHVCVQARAKTRRAFSLPDAISILKVGTAPQTRWTCLTGQSGSHSHHNLQKTHQDSVSKAEEGRKDRRGREAFVGPQRQSWVHKAPWREGPGEGPERQGLGKDLAIKVGSLSGAIGMDTCTAFTVV